MIQTALSFVLGFLSAAFLALLVAPAIWRRAVVLTRKRVEASLPLTMDEIHADKDRQRAEFAVTARKLEMSVKALKEKTAGQAVEIGRIREELALAGEENRDKSGVIADREARIAALGAELEARQEELRQLSEKLAHQEAVSRERAAELEKLGRMYDEASFSASSRQIELAAQEAKLEKLAGDLTALGRERKEVDARAREAASDNKGLREALRAREKELRLVSAKLEQQEKLAAERGDEVARLDRLHGEASAAARSSQAEAASQAVKLGKLTADHTALRGKFEQADARARDVAADNKNLREALGAAEKNLKRVSDRLAQQEKLAAGQAAELEKRGRMYEEARAAAANRQDELTDQKATVDRIAADLAVLREERRKADAVLRDTGSQNKALGQALKSEQSKTAALERKLETLIASLAEREEKLERRERELGRLREQKGNGPAPAAPAIAETADHARLQERLQLLTRENRKLREALDRHPAGGGNGGGGKSEGAEGDALLREKISDLAAEVVHLTAMLDAPDTLLRDALATPSQAPGTAGTSLAERIRALQDAASTR